MCLFKHKQAVLQPIYPYILAKEKIILLLTKNKLENTA